MVYFQKPTISKLATDSSCELTREKLGRKKKHTQRKLFVFVQKRSKNLIFDKLEIKKVVMKTEKKNIENLLFGTTYRKY